MSGSVTSDQQLFIGFERLRCGFLNQAELIFLDLLAREPANPTAFRLLGVSRCKMGRVAQGVADLRRAVELSPETEVFWNDLAAALRELGDLPGAQAAYARAGALRDPKLAPLMPFETLVFATDRAVHTFEHFDYPYTARIRYGAGHPPHARLAEIIGAGRDRYAGLVAQMAGIQADLATIPFGGTGEELTPYWLNAWYPTLDGIALTAMLRAQNPARMVEIGSGMSTKYARRAIRTYGLRTRVTSIDPHPRADIDQLCDQVIRKPLEACAPEMFDVLGPGDIFFLDSSHRAFQGSDVTVFFLEILPRLKPGVIVHIHDIYLPDDYISGHVHRMWNEQYLLATALLFAADRFELLFPTWFISRDPELRAQARAAVCHGALETLDLYGASFWMRVRG